VTALFESVNGELVSHDGIAALLLEPSFEQVYLRYMLRVTGSEELFMPELLLDDWGHEIKTLDLYRWIQKNGNHFPRAELFGYSLDGEKRQYFIRELDLVELYPCYGFKDPGSSLTDGLLIEHIVMCDKDPVAPHRSDAPSDFVEPIINASVTWWRVNLADALAYAKRLIDYQD
jgi:hypothetical protein